MLPRYPNHQPASTTTQYYTRYTPSPGTMVFGFFCCFHKYFDSSHHAPTRSLSLPLFLAALHPLTSPHPTSILFLSFGRARAFFETLKNTPRLRVRVVRVRISLLPRVAAGFFTKKKSRLNEKHAFLPQKREFFKAFYCSRTLRYITQRVVLRRVFSATSSAGKRAGTIRAFI